MPIEPQVFLSYGRPDKDLAFQLTCGLWDRRIDCYNYQAKPVMERIGGDPDHTKYLYGIRFFVAVMTADTLWRETVVMEHVNLEQLNRAIGRDIPKVYVTTERVLNSGPYPGGELALIDPTRAGGTAPIVEAILSLMGEALIERAQARWDVNKQLYPDAWREVDAALAAGRGAPTALPDAAALMAREVGDAWLENALRAELGVIQYDGHRWVFLLCLASLVEIAGLPMGRELRELVPLAVRLGHQEPFVQAALASPLEPVPGGPLDGFFGAITATRQIERSLEWMRSGEAVEIARRVTWPVTRRILLSSIYYAASGLADGATRRVIAEDLRLAEAG